MMRLAGKTAIVTGDRYAVSAGIDGERGAAQPGERGEVVGDPRQQGCHRHVARAEVECLGFDPRRHVDIIDRGEQVMRLVADRRRVNTVRLRHRAEQLRFDHLGKAGNGVGRRA